MKTIIIIIFLSISFNSYCQNGTWKAWIEVDYLKCLSKKLPDKCFNWKVYYKMYYDLNDTLFFNGNKIVNYRKGDTTSFSTKSNYLNDQIDTIVEHILVCQDTLYYTNKRMNTYNKFVYKEIYANFEDSISIKFINKLLQNNEHPDIYAIMESDSIYFSYAEQLGINRLHSNEKDYTIEIRNNNLLINHLIYNYEPGIFKIVKFKKFKLKRK